MDDRWWIERGRVGCDEAVGAGKSERCLTLAELELDMCWDRHPCSSVVQGVCMCTCVGCLYSSMWDVTKYGGWSPSLMGVNWVSDRVGIDSTEYMHCISVCFSGSLEQVTVVDFWGRNGTIPMGTELFLLSNRLQGFWWDRTILDWDFSVYVVVSTYTSMSVTKGFGIFTDQKIVSMGLWKGRPNAAVM